MLQNKPTIKIKELAKETCSTVEQVFIQLKLDKLSAEAIRFLYAENLCVHNAYMLAKLFLEDQYECMNKALLMVPEEFAYLVLGKIK